MKKRKAMLILLIPILLFTACKGAKKFFTSLSSKDTPTAIVETIPDDFGFVYRYNFTEVDTFQSTIKNTYYFEKEDADAITSFSFSDEQMKEIYEAFIENEIQGLPEEIDPDKEIMSIPPSYYELQYTINGESKGIICGTGASIDQKGISKDNNKFVKFMEKVWENVYQSDSYELLPEGPFLE